MNIGIIDYNPEFREMFMEQLINLKEIEEVITEKSLSDFFLNNSNSDIRLIFIHERVIIASTFKELNDLKKRSKNTKIVFISEGASIEYFLNSLKKEMKAFILSINSMSQLSHLFTCISKESITLSPEVFVTILKKISSSSKIQNEELEKLLTKREKDVVNQLIKGLSYNEIATILQISPHTVNDHLLN